MKPDLISLLDKNGYAVYQTDEYFIVRRKLVASWAVLALFLVLGLSFTSLGLLTVSIGISWSISIPITAVGIILIMVPFFNYLTASYRSLMIDREHKTLLFRSGYSRAYLFTEVKDVKLEVQARQTGTHAYSDSNKEFLYTITAYMVRGDKEPLLSLRFSNEDSEHLMFDLKDYFQTILTYN